LKRLETGGTKAQLIARIQGDDAPAATAAPKKGKAAPKKAAAPKKKKKVEEEEPEEEEPEEEEQAPKASKAAKSGASATAHESRRIAVDRGVPLAGASVYPGHGVMLNQTNIANNNNKFYVIQLLDQGSGKFAVWTRWGRVGEPGQNSCKQGLSLAAAQSEFAKKFREKTKNVWSATIRDNFKAQPGKYTLLDMKEDDDEEEGAPKKVAVKHVNKDSKLPQDLQVFVRKIYAQATGNLKRAIDCEFTSKGIKTPLGVLSLAQVGRGDDVLERIQAVLEGTASDSLEQLSSEYYTLIPHAHGRVKPKLVNNKLILQEKKDLSQLMKG
jgi:poly [ADP-ribose] polymerase